MFKRLMERLNTGAAPAPPAAEPVAAELVPAPTRPDFQKTMGRDQVTGLPNRACFVHVLALQGQISSRLETRLSLLVLDWAGYATAGQDPAARDRRLAAMAAAVRRELLRTHDVLGSLGEGRLAAMLPFTDAAGADTVARKLQRAAQEALLAATAPQLALELPGDEEAPTPDWPGPATPFDTAAPLLEGDAADWINIGLASYSGKGPLAEDALLTSAEKAVAFAALNGGDRIVRYDLAGLGSR